MHWKLIRTQDGVYLHLDAARMPWVPAKVLFAITKEPLRYTRVDYNWPAGTEDAAEVLDRLGVPLDAP